MSPLNFKQQPCTDDKVNPIPLSINTILDTELKISSCVLFFDVYDCDFNKSLSNLGQTNISLVRVTSEFGSFGNAISPETVTRAVLSSDLTISLLAL